MTTSRNTKNKRKSSGSKAEVVPEDLLNKEVRFTMTPIKENPDGSVDYSLNMSEYTHAKLVEMAVIGLIKEHIAKEKKPWYKRIFKHD